MSRSFAQSFFDTLVVFTCGVFLGPLLYAVAVGSSKGCTHRLCVRRGRTTTDPPRRGRSRRRTDRVAGGAWAWARAGATTRRRAAGGLGAAAHSQRHPSLKFPLTAAAAAAQPYLEITRWTTELLKIRSGGDYSVLPE